MTRIGIASMVVVLAGAVIACGGSSSSNRRGSGSGGNGAANTGGGFNPTQSGGNGSSSVGGNNGCGNELAGVIRDFSSSHPDFEAELGTDKGIVEVDLGSDMKPVYAGGTANPPPPMVKRPSISGTATRPTSTSPFPTRSS